VNDMEDTTEERTPENTPLPGGGSWMWDSKARAWVPSAPAPTDTEQE